MRYTFLTATVLLAITLVSGQSPLCKNYPCNANNEGQHLPCEGDDTKFWLCNEWLGPNTPTGQVIECCIEDGQQMYFNPDNGYCELISIPSPNPTPSPPTPEGPTTPPVCPNPCDQSNEFTLQPCEGDCTKFWMCNQYIPGVSTGLLIDCCKDDNGNFWYFDGTSCSSDPSVCDATSSTPSPITPSTKPPKTPKTPAPITPSTEPGCISINPCDATNQLILLPDNCDCTKFWMCNEFVPGMKPGDNGIQIDCCEDRNGQIWYWNPQLKECSQDPNVCDATPSPETPSPPTPSPITPSTKPPKTPKPPAPTTPPTEPGCISINPCDAGHQLMLLPDSCDCTKFWMCNEFVPGMKPGDNGIQIDCCEDRNGQIWYWNPQSEECSPNPNVCDATPSPETPSPPTPSPITPSTKPPKTPKPPAPTTPPTEPGCISINPCDAGHQLMLLPDNCDCTKFWMCNEFVPGMKPGDNGIQIDCCEDRNGQIWYWNPQSEECSPNPNVCTYTPKPTPEPTPPVTESECEISTNPCDAEHQNVLLPDKCDCTKFWMCNQFVPGMKPGDNGILIDCCEDRNGQIWYWDPKKEVCSPDPTVC